MRKHINIYCKLRNIDNIFIKCIDAALVRRYRVHRVPVASFWNFPIYPILDSCPVTVQYSFLQMKYRKYWMITWGKSAFVIGQFESSGYYIYIVRFVDLAQRDSWLSGTKHLNNYSGKVSIRPDLPPVIRPMKDELIEVRSKLPRYIKLMSKLKFLPHWPFLELRIDGQTPKRPSISLNAVTTKMLDIEPLLTLR